MSVMSLIHVRIMFVISLITQQGISRIRMASVLLPIASYVYYSIHLSFIMHHRKTCLKPPRYSFRTTATLPADTAPPPICIADKPKRHKQITNVFIDDRGFPNKSEYYNSLLHNISGGPILCKLKLPPPLFDEVDPAFFCA